MKKTIMRAITGSLLILLLLSGCNLPSPGGSPTTTPTRNITPVFGNTPIFGDTPLIPATTTPSATPEVTNTGPEDSTPDIPGPNETSEGPSDTTPGAPPGSSGDTTPTDDEGADGPPGSQQTQVTRDAPTPERPPGSTPNPPTQPTSTRVIAGQPSERPGAMLYAQYISNAPTIDGFLDDWQIPSNAATKVTYQTADWAGQENLSFRYTIAWDEDYLYLAFDVTDAFFMQEASGNQIFKGDGMEILLDTDLDTDFNQAALNNDDFQLGLSGGSGSPGLGMQNYLWYPQYKTGYQSDILTAGQPTELGYTIETAIPWSVFNVIPYDGQGFGFVLSLHNNDLPGKQLQSIISTAPVRLLTDPTTWGSLILSK